MPERITERDNFIYLLIALIFLLFSGAIFEQIDYRAGQWVVNTSLMVTLLVGIWSMERKNTTWVSPKIGMTLEVAILMITDSLIESNFLATVQLVASFLFLSLTTYLAWRQVMFTGAIDANKIVGAICIYILLGLVWAFAYMICEALFPGSLAGLDSEQWQYNMDDVIYYSMVTLTTLGYGDITPEQPLIRMLAYLEAVTGIFYTTVLVASLIGMRLASFTEEFNKRDDAE